MGREGSLHQARERNQEIVVHTVSGIDKGPGKNGVAQGGDGEIGRFLFQPKHVGFDPGGLAVVQPAAQRETAAGAQAGINLLIAEEDSSPQLSQDACIRERCPGRAGREQRRQALPLGAPAQVLAPHPGPAEGTTDRAWP